MAVTVDIRIELLRRGLTIKAVADRVGKNPDYLSLVLSARVRASDELYGELRKFIGRELVDRLSHQATLALNPVRAPAASPSGRGR